MESAKRMCYILLTSYLINEVHSICICPGEEPAFWENPCGSQIQIQNDTSFQGYAGQGKLLRKMVFKALKRVQQELNLSLYYFRSKNFSNLYHDIEPLVQQHQYKVPSWLPGKGDVESLTVSGKPLKEIPKLFRSLFTGLQKFAVAFEQITHDETDETKDVAVMNIHLELSHVLCEIKTSLISMDMSVPVNLQRNIMSERERNLTDSIQRGIRDYGILKKYGEFINQWANLFQNVKKRRDTNRKSKKEQKPRK